MPRSEPARPHSALAHALVPRACLLAALAASASAADTYYRVPLSSLEVTDGAKPPMEAPRYRANGSSYLVLELGEAYLWSAGWHDPYDALVGGNTGEVLVRTDAPLPLAGLLVLSEGRPDTAIKVHVRIGPGATTATAADFAGASAFHAQCMLNASAACTAWWRHRAAVAVSPTATGIPGLRSRIDDGDDFDLMTGDRALAESLQLDRELRFGGAGTPPAGNTGKPEPTVAVATLPGIAIPGLDLAKIAPDDQDPHGAPMTPAQEAVARAADPLAACIPADQHAIFFPSFAALMDTLDRADATVGTLGYLERAMDSNTRRRYERQLCLDDSQVARALGPAVISSVACTGSVPYLISGTDVALLFVTAHPEVVEGWLLARQRASGAPPVAGSVGTLSYHGAVSADRAVSSYCARLSIAPAALPGASGAPAPNAGPLCAVVVTNSLAQLARLAAVGAHDTPALASSAAYAFFRTRYPLASDEMALAVISDAAIARWCSARWRIADRRRVLAGAALAELQARLVEHEPPGAVASALASSLHLDLGTVSELNGACVSSIYGSLSFLTPIAEMPITQVSLGEEMAYRRFLQAYQYSWSRWFDPIAARISHAGAGVGVDLSVLPLTIGTTYREILDVIGDASFTAGQGDPHLGVLAHGVIAIDHANPELRSAAGIFPDAVQRLGGDPFSWLGSSLAVYADADPVWQAIFGAGDPESNIDRHLSELPIAVDIAVANPLKAGLFLTVLHGLIDESAPGMVTWSTRTWHDHPYAVLSPTDTGAQQLGSARDTRIYYAAMPSDLVLSLREDVLQRAIDRIAARGATAAGAAPAASPPPWLGRQVALRMHGPETCLWILRNSRMQDSQAALQATSWANLPILNEWHRRFPGEDPVAVHERLWGERLVCPGGGRYVWNQDWQTMESTAYGHPCAPKPGPALASLLGPLGDLDTGLTLTRLTATRAADAQLAPAEQRALAAAQDMQHEPQQGSDYGLRVRLTLGAAPAAP